MIVVTQYLSLVLLLVQVSLLIPYRCAGANSVEDACTGVGDVYYVDACYTLQLDVKAVSEHYASDAPCPTKNGLEGHMAYPTSQSVIDAWFPFIAPRPSQLHFIGLKRMSPVSTKEDHWYLTTNGGGTLHSSPLQATLSGDPAKLIPWAASATAQPDSSTTESCAVVTYWSGAIYGIWDNNCGQSGVIVCEYSVPQNQVNNVHMVRHMAAAGMQLKQSVVTETVHLKNHLLCLMHCVDKRAGCRCVAYSRSAKTCALSPFPCHRADIFQADTVGDTAVYTRKV